MEIDYNVIPAMTHPLSKGWSQPDANDILLDDTHAMMTQETYDKLHKYNYGPPTGMYEGKMWASEYSNPEDKFLCVVYSHPTNAELVRTISRIVWIV